MASVKRLNRLRKLRAMAQSNSVAEAKIAQGLLDRMLAQDPTEESTLQEASASVRFSAGLQTERDLAVCVARATGVQAFRPARGLGSRSKITFRGEVTAVEYAVFIFERDLFLLREQANAASCGFLAGRYGHVLKQTDLTQDAAESTPAWKATARAALQPCREYNYTTTCSNCVLWLRCFDMETHMKFDIVFYHAGCVDGTCAAALLALYNPEAQFIAAWYGMVMPDVSGKSVACVDFSFSVTEVQKSKASAFYVFDHHKTFADKWGIRQETYVSEYRPNYWVYYAAAKSGAQIVYDWLYPGAEGSSIPLKLIPFYKVVEFVADYDLWKFELPETKAVNAWLDCLPKEPTEFANIIQNHKGILPLDVGRGILVANNNHVQRTIQQAYGNAYVQVLNTPILQNECAEALRQKHRCGLVVLWYIRKNGTVKVSLRSAFGFDCRVVAQQYGGGGHKESSGCEFSTYEEFTASELMRIQ